MSDAPFHTTRMGQRFCEHSVPELVRQLARLNEALERLLDREQHLGCEGDGDTASPENRQEASR